MFMSGLKCTVIVPPMTQLNTPYASLPTLAGILRGAGHQVHCWDASIDTALALYSSAGVRRLFAAMEERGIPQGYEEVFANRERYARVIEPVIAFLQGQESGLAQRITRQAWLPQGPRFAQIGEGAEIVAFGQHGIGDHARYLCTLVLQDLADAWRLSVSPDFGLTSYAERVAMSAASFDALAEKLAQDLDPIEEILLELCAEEIAEDQQLIVLSVPFPGNLPAALRIAQWCKEHRPFARIALGGGYPSTELREISDARIFEIIDHILLDEGEDALPALCAHIQDVDKKLVRSYQKDAEAAVYYENSARIKAETQLHDPDYSTIDLGRYLDLIDTWNPAQRLWNEGRWLKIIAARGCYWKRCSFCDVTLPYIADYKPESVEALADRMDALHEQTGLSTFHFTDEAAPPALLLGLAIELLRRERSYSWWGNIRFDTYFTPDRCRALAAGGMIAVTGGLETANDRLLPKIAKGVSVQQAVQVSKAFADAGILVHAYLMYGFPTETLQDSIDSMEVVRQMMRAGCLHSAFWHRFTVTAHSPVGQDPTAFDVRITGPEFEGFAKNNLEHVELSNDADHTIIGVALQRAMSHWLRGEGLENDLAKWFEEADFFIPDAQIPSDIVTRYLAEELGHSGKRLLWLGEDLLLRDEDFFVTDECGELHQFPRNDYVEELLEDAQNYRLKELRKYVEDDAQILSVLGPLGLCVV